MCIIVDTNVAFELTNNTVDGRPVLQWLLQPRRKAGLVIGGDLLRELGGNKFGAVLKTLRQAGRLHTIPAKQIALKQEALEATGVCKSNDAHVIALSLVAQCNIVFTRDLLLHADLRTHSMPGKRISIYQNASHKHLLTECTC